MSKLQVTRQQSPTSTFPPVYVTYIPWRKRWRMVADYQCSYAGMTFLIPVDFEFDLSSVPRWLWPVVSSFELSIVAPLVHDYFYRYEGKAIHHTPNKTVNRLQADQIFHDMMIMEGVPRWKANGAYRAVRTFARRW